MGSKSIRILSLIALLVGIILVLLPAFILTPEFLATHFDFVGELDSQKTQEIQFDRYLTISIGVLIAAVGILYLVLPSMVNGLYDRALYWQNRIQSRKFYLIFCLACILIVLAFGFWGTWSGPGLSADSITYTAVGESLYRGEGFNDYIRGGTFTRGAPLYPMSIAALMYLGLDVMQAARLVPILSFAVMITALFFLVRKTNNILPGVTVCLITLAIMQVLFMAVMAWTEMLFVMLSVLALLFITKYTRDDRARIAMLCIAGVFSALAMLTRYIGITVALTCLLVIVVNNRINFKKFVPHALIYGLIAGIPVVPWLYRNWTLTSQLQGFSAESSGVGIVQNIKLAITTLLGGYSIGEIAHLYNYAYIILAILVIVVGLIIYFVKKNASEKAPWSSYIKNNYIIISYTIIYIAGIIIIRANLFHGIEHRDLAPVYPFLTTSIITFIFHAYTQVERPPIKPVLFKITATFCVLLFIFLMSTSVYFLQNAKNGLGLNTPFWRESPSLTWAKSNLPDDADIYSNAARAINARLRKPCSMLPEREDDSGIEALIETLESSDNIFIIAFGNYPDIPEITATRLSSNDMVTLNENYNLLTVSAEFPEATLWQVRR